MSLKSDKQLLDNLQGKADREEKVLLHSLGLLDRRGRIINPFDERSKEDIEHPELHLIKIMSDPRYFYFTCKYLLNISILPFQCVILRELWKRPFPMLIGSRGCGKSWILGVYFLLRMLFIPGRKLVITGAGFRQSKIIMQYGENIWRGSPILRSVAGQDKYTGLHRDADKWMFTIGESVAYALPIGSGDKIRGYRAHDTICDEYASIAEEVYKTVIQGFGYVNLSPAEKVLEAQRIESMKDLGYWNDELEALHSEKVLGNQSVISGTGFWQFNHFAQEWKNYKGIIESKGAEIQSNNPEDDEKVSALDWRDFSIIRLPVDLVPPGFMSAKTIARSRKSMGRGTYLNELGACFSADSNGFFRRGLIETCVTHEPIQPEGGYSAYKFGACIKGIPNSRYIFGVDLASQKDNTAIVILEIFPDHRRVVYCWTSNSKQHRARINAGLQVDNTFYGFVAKKIRTLMKIFPCELISMDSQGGGRHVLEALQDPDKIPQGEQPIYPINEFHALSGGKGTEYDNYPGLHIVELVQFVNAEWTTMANNGMKKDLEDRVLLFPGFDPITLAEANTGLMEGERGTDPETMKERIFDTLEDCVEEIEDMKEEMSTIVCTSTPTGRNHWDTPETKIEGSKKGRMKKDRYSAILMANGAARRISRTLEAPHYVPQGGVIGKMEKTKVRGQMYVSGPEWFTNPANASVGAYGAVVRGGRG